MYFICRSFLLCIIICASMLNLRSFLPLFHFSYTEEQKVHRLPFSNMPNNRILFSIPYNFYDNGNETSEGSNLITLRCRWVLLGKFASPILNLYLWATQTECSVLHVPAIEILNSDCAGFSFCSCLVALYLLYKVYSHVNSQLWSPPLERWVHYYFLKYKEDSPA